MEDQPDKPSKFDRIKAHVKRHQMAYGFGAGVVTFIGVYVVGSAILRLAQSQPNTVTIMPVFNNFNTTNMGGHMTKLVECVETGETWKTVTDSAKSANAPVSLMSRHLNGHKPDVYGRHYQIIGIGTTG